MSEPIGTRTAEENRDSPRIRLAKEALAGGTKFLDIGCNCGWFLDLPEIMADTMVGVDIDESFVKELQDKGKEVYHAASWQLPFNDNTFDRIHFGQTIAHMKRDLGIKSLMEIQRILTPDGTAFVSTVVGPMFSSGLFYATNKRLITITTPYYHIHEWEPPDMFSVIQSLQFELKRFHLLTQVDPDDPTFKPFRNVQCWILGKGAL
ncbi:MAG: class I SAM-dependent methyltransferase [Candidatus Thorarchaeota archaeon]